MNRKHFRNFAAFFLGFVLVCVAGVASAAAPTCYNWTVYQSGGTLSYTGNVPYVGDTQHPICPLLASALVGYENASIRWDAVTGSWTSSGGSTYGRCALSYTQYNKSNGTTTNPSGNSQPIARGSTATCPAPPVDSCAAAKDLADPLVHMGADSVGGELCASDDGEGGTYSGGDNGKGCAVIKTGAGILSATTGHWYGQVRYTGVSCGSAADPENFETTANCIATGGTTLCVSKEEKNCGSVGGESVCLDDVPEGNCMLLAGGGALCTDGAADAPSDGTDPLDPTAQMTHTDTEEDSDEEGDTTTINYYGPSSVAESETDVGGTSNPSYDLGGGGIGGEDGGGWTDPGLGGDWVADISGVPIVAALGGVFTVPATSETCPEHVITIPIVDVEWDLYGMTCELWPSVGSVLFSISLLGFTILGATIILRA